jgi:hypothetical protein
LGENRSSVSFKLIFPEVAMRWSQSRSGWLAAIGLGGLLFLVGCAGGEYEDQFQKSLKNLKATGQAIPRSGVEAPPDNAPAAPGDQPANPAPAPAPAG